jgi:branched-chain amino acid transport system ATP-binding protein
LLELDRITGGYDSTIVLRDVSVTIPSGSVVALLGPNGAGKSTLLRAMSGLFKARSGRVLLDGVDITKAAPSRRARMGICHVMEGRSIWPSLTVRENLLLEAPRGTRAAEVLERSDAVFPQLSSRHRQTAGTLSGGEQQMLALMRAHLANPRVVLVDEASLGLAPMIVDRIYEFLDGIAGDGVSLVVVEQYVQRALAIASDVYVLNHGRIVHAGPSSQLNQEQIFALYTQQPTPTGVQSTGGLA